VVVTLKYYVPLVPVDDTVAELTKDGKKLAEVTGYRCWHPEMSKKRNQYGGFEPQSYPHYVYISVADVVEVVEHAGGPTFSISDDAGLKTEALKSAKCEK
jgi:hypothetical protein